MDSMPPVRQPVKGIFLILAGLLIALILTVVAIYSKRIQVGILAMFSSWFVYRGVRCIHGTDVGQVAKMSDLMLPDSVQNPVGHPCRVCERNMPFSHEAGVCQHCGAMFHLTCRTNGMCPSCMQSHEN